MKNDNSLDKFVEKYPTYIEALDIIDDLKKQLEEKEKIEYTDTINFVETSEPDIVAKELDRLNEQLAEKEKEIEKLKLDLGMFKSVNEFLNRMVLKKQEKFCCKSKKTKRQDKISFAVEQLEKVKENTKIFFVKATHKHNEHYSAQYNMITDFDLCFAIDNQIKQLKEGKWYGKI